MDQRTLSRRAPLRGILILGVLCFVWRPAVVSAQDATPRFLPYGFVAPGTVSSGLSLHAGGGIDLVVRRGLGASLEGGYLGPFPDGFDQGVGIVSVNAVYHVAAPGPRRWTPFVTGGYSVWFRGQSGHAVNVGGGANYWLTNRTGLRLELRDHVRLEDRLTNGHLWGMRVGIIWNLP